jgi:hypothetical protein
MAAREEEEEEEEEVEETVEKGARRRAEDAGRSLRVRGGWRKAEATWRRRAARRNSSRHDVLGRCSYVIFCVVCRSLLSKTAYFLSFLLRAL